MEPSPHGDGTWFVNAGVEFIHAIVPPGVAIGRHGAEGWRLAMWSIDAIIGADDPLTNERLDISRVLEILPHEHRAEVRRLIARHLSTVRTLGQVTPAQPSAGLSRSVQRLKHEMTVAASGRRSAATERGGRADDEPRRRMAGDGTAPQDYQRIGIAATPSLRQGPGSPMAALLRELTPYFHQHLPHLYALEGTYRTIVRTGLLRGYPEAHLHCLAPGRLGGMADLGAALVKDRVTGVEDVFGDDYRTAEQMLDLDYELDCVIYLIDPTEATGILPATLTLKRAATVADKPLFDSFPSAIEWFGLLGSVSGGPVVEEHLLDDEMRAGMGYDTFVHGGIALLAADTQLPQLLDFVERNAGFLKRFRGVLATERTARLLNPHGPEASPDRETFEHAVRMRETLARHGIEGSWVRELKSCNDGGYLEVAESVTMGVTTSVVFLRDQTTPEVQPGAEMLERAALIANNADSLPDAAPMFLRNARAARSWAALWSAMPGGASPATLTSAYRERLGVQLVLAASKDSDDEQWDAIAEEAAWYLISALATGRRSRQGEPRRATVACGSAMRKVIANIGDPVAFDLIDRINAHNERQAEMVRRCKERFDFAARVVDAIARRRRLTLDTTNTDPASLWSIGDVCVAPMVGMFGSTRRSVEANHNAGLLADVVDGERLLLAASAYVSGADDIPDDIAKHWQRTDVLLMACDDLKQHWFGSAGQVALPAGLYDDLRGRGAVGEIGGMYLDAEGRQVSPLGYVRQGMSLADMAAVARAGDGSAAIMIAGANTSRDGRPPRRVAAVLAALRAGIVSVLVSDPAFARAVLRAHIAGSEAAAAGAPTIAAHD